MLFEIGEHRLYRAGHVVDIEPVEPRHRLRRTIAIERVEIVHQAGDHGVAPHPGREPQERAPGAGAGRLVTDVPVEHRGVGPVGLGGDHGEAVPLDEAAGDRGARGVEFVRAVAGFAQQHDLAIGEAIEGRGEGFVVDVRQRLGGFGDELGKRLRSRGQVVGGGAAAILVPAMLADQRYEADTAEVMFLPGVLAGAGDAQQGLQALASDRNDEPPAELELTLERLGDTVASRGDEDRVERRFVGQAQAAVAVDNGHIVIAERVDSLGGRPGERLVPFDREHLPGDARHHRRRIARAGTHLEHLPAGRDLRGVDHERDDVGLRDRLPLADRQRAVFVGEFAHRLGNEGFARDRAERRQQVRRVDAAAANLPLDHPFAQFLRVGHRRPPQQGAQPPAHFVTPWRGRALSIPRAGSSGPSPPPRRCGFAVAGGSAGGSARVSLGRRRSPADRPRR